MGRQRAEPARGTTDRQEKPVDIQNLQVLFCWPMDRTFVRLTEIAEFGRRAKAFGA